MDAYTNMRRELAAVLNDAHFNADDILYVIDSVVCNYNIEKRERNCLTALDLLNEYISCCEYEKMSAGTIENYRLILSGLLSSLSVPINKIRTVDLRGYLRDYQNKRGIADSTLNKYREYFCAFFGWCVNEGYCERNPASELKPIRCEKKQREFYTQTELELIRVACLDDRDIALVEVLYSTGCRVSELCHLKKNDINWESGTVQLYGKGKKHRISYLNAKASVHLKRYLDNRTDNEEWLFLSKRGAHSMTPAGIQKILRDIYLRTNGSLTKKVTPHGFRHTLATTAMQHGMPVEDVQALLGHENIDTTMVYARTCDENVRMNHKKYIM